MENHIDIESPREKVFGLAARIEEWPRILPHYREVKLLEDRNGVRVAEMRAWRGRIPVRWLAQQSISESEQRVRFRHLGGATRGMEVEWRFEPRSQPPGTRVVIAHRLSSGIPLVGPLVSMVIGRLFVDYIASRTLARMKVIAESDDLV